MISVVLLIVPSQHSNGHVSSDSMSQSVSLWCHRALLFTIVGWDATFELLMLSAKSTGHAR